MQTHCANTRSAFSYLWEKPKLHELKKNKTFIYNVQALAPCSHGLLGCWVEHACVDAETLGVEQAHVEAEI